MWKATASSFKSKKINLAIILPSPTVVFSIQRVGPAILYVFAFELFICKLEQDSVVMLTLLQLVTATSKAVTFESFENKTESKALSSFSFKLL